jgi:hypothetical protein
MFDIFLDGINQLRLVLLDSTSDLDKGMSDKEDCNKIGTNLGANEECIELRENTEHLVRISCCP